MILIKYESYPISKICPYCGGNVILTTNDFIYGRKYGKHGNCNCYACVNCKASVGTHPDGKTPLGLLADRALKDLKVKAHSLFDPYYQSGAMKKNVLYKWLAEQLGIPYTECHFGWFDKDMLLKAINILETQKPIKGQNT